MPKQVMNERFGKAALAKQISTLISKTRTKPYDVFCCVGLRLSGVVEFAAGPIRELLRSIEVLTRR